MPHARAMLDLPEIASSTYLGDRKAMRWLDDRYVRAGLAF
jgi:hypothetical protein